MLSRTEMSLDYSEETPCPWQIKHVVVSLLPRILLNSQVYVWLMRRRLDRCLSLQEHLRTIAKDMDLIPSTHIRNLRMICNSSSRTSEFCRYQHTCGTHNSFRHTLLQINKILNTSLKWVEWEKKKSESEGVKLASLRSLLLVAFDGC